MDFALALTSGAGRAVDGAQSALVPSLLQVLSASGQTTGTRRTSWVTGEDSATCESARERRRRTDGADTPTEVIAQAEQQRAPGTHAFRKDTLQSQFREHLNEQRQAQREASQSATSNTHATTAAKSTALTDTDARAMQDSRATSTSTRAAAATTDAAKPVADAASSPTTAETAAPAAATPRLAVRTADVLRTSNSDAAKVQAVTSAQTASQVAGRALAGAFTATTEATGAASGTTNTATNGVTRASPVAAASGADRTAATVAAKKAATTATTAQTSESDANTERILRFIQTRVGKDHSTATLRLDPPELGSLRIQLDLCDDELTVQMEARSDAARRVLAEQLDALRQGLESAGLHVAHVELRVAAAPQAELAGDATPQNAWTGAQDASPQSRDQSAADHEAGTESPPYESAGEVESIDVLRPATSTRVNVWA